MRSLNDSKTTVTLLAGLTLVGALAGCSTTTPDAGTDSSKPAPAPSAPATADSGASTGSGTYKDGTYTESGSYQAPSGTETVDVTLTLAGDKVTAVEVTGHATDPQAQKHQGEFKDGIAAEVVGKSITDLKVDRVGGSSLTSGGFNKAVDAIKADAAE